MVKTYRRQAWPPSMDSGVHDIHARFATSTREKTPPTFRDGMRDRRLVLVNVAFSQALESIVVSQHYGQANQEQHPAS